MATVLYQSADESLSVTIATHWRVQPLVVVYLDCMFTGCTPVVIQKLREQLKGLEEELGKVPVTLEELKQVLNVINTIRTTSMNMELRYIDLEERFR